MRGLAFTVWWLHYQAEFVSPYSLPYATQSPLSYTEKKYETIDDIWDEINDIAIVNDSTSRSIGQDLFHLVPLFTNPKYVISEWAMEMVNEYRIIKTMNVSLGVLDDINAHRIYAFTIVNNEMNAIFEYEKLKDGSK